MTYSQFPTKVIEWIYLPHKFMGRNDIGHYYTLFFSDIKAPDNLLFTIRFEREIKNANERVFFLRTETQFQIETKGEKPLIEFLFSLVDLSTFEFAKIYHDRVRGTNLEMRQIAKPTLQSLFPLLQQCIDSLDRPTSLN